MFFNQWLKKDKNRREKVLLFVNILLGMVVVLFFLLFYYPEGNEIDEKGNEIIGEIYRGKDGLVFSHKKKPAFGNKEKELKLIGYFFQGEKGIIFRHNEKEVIKGEGGKFTFKNKE